MKRVVAAIVLLSGLAGMPAPAAPLGSLIC